MILNEIFRVVSRFPRYISCHIAESRDSAFHFEAKRTRRWAKRHSEKRLISTFFRGVSKKSKNYWFLYTVLYSTVSAKEHGANPNSWDSPFTNKFEAKIVTLKVYPDMHESSLGAAYTVRPLLDPDPEYLSIKKQFNKKCSGANFKISTSHMRLYLFQNLIQ